MRSGVRLIKVLEKVSVPLGSDSSTTGTSYWCLPHTEHWHLCFCEWSEKQLGSPRWWLTRTVYVYVCGCEWGGQIVVQWAFFSGFIDNTWAHLKERKKRGKIPPWVLLSRQTGPGWFQTAQTASLSLIEPLKSWNYSSAVLWYPHRFHRRVADDVSGVLCLAVETPCSCWLHSPSRSHLQGHPESHEPAPRGLLAPLGLVALQVVRALQVWGDHRDHLGTATPLSVLAFLTTDKVTQVCLMRCRSCMVLHQRKLQVYARLLDWQLIGQIQWMEVWMQQSVDIGIKLLVLFPGIRFQLLMLLCWALLVCMWQIFKNSNFWRSGQIIWNLYI